MFKEPITSSHGFIYNIMLNATYMYRQELSNNHKSIKPEDDGSMVSLNDGKTLTMAHSC
jgi:hypothetical protein